MSLVVMIWAAPGLLLPLLLGLPMWRASKDEPFRRAITLFALKPLLATPIASLLIATVLNSGKSTSAPVVMIPGALLTLLILGYNFRTLLRRPVIALALVAGDLVRWVLPFIIVANSFSATPMGIPFGSLDIPQELVRLALLWTNAYAGICWAVTRAMRSAPQSPPV